MLAFADRRLERGRLASPSPLHISAVRWSLLSAITALTLCAAVSQAAAEPRFTIAGSTTIGDALMPALVESYALSEGLSLIRERAADTDAEALRVLFGVEPVFTVDMLRNGSSAGIDTLLAGDAAIGMASRRIRGSEAAAAEGADMLNPESEHVLALDGIAVIVASANPMASISLKELAGIFSGRITDWRELGLPPGAIAVHSRPNGSGTLDSFTSVALAPFDARIKEGAPEQVTNEAMVAAVAADPLAIGFASIAFVDAAKAVPILLECGVLATPDTFSVKAEEYPLSRRLFLYTQGAPEPAEARALIDFALSDTAQPVIAKAGMVAHDMSAQTAEGSSSRLINAMQAPSAADAKDSVRRFAQVARSAARLSTTFRFTDGDLLDAKAFADAGRVARWLSRPENAAATLTLIGFTDSAQSADANLQVAMSRAEAVRRAVLIQVDAGFNAGRLKVDAFGPVAPVACDDSAAGRAANNRVEVWVDR